MRISGGCDGDIAECAQESRLLIGGVVDCSTPDIALWKGLHVQAGHDTEVVAATFKRPEDIGIGALCDFTDGAIGEDGLLYHSSTLSFSKRTRSCSKRVSESGTNRQDIPGTQAHCHLQTRIWQRSTKSHHPTSGLQHQCPQFCLLPRSTRVAPTWCTHPTTYSPAPGSLGSCPHST